MKFLDQTKIHIRSGDGGPDGDVITNSLCIQKMLVKLLQSYLSWSTALRVRHLISNQKSLKSETLWSSKDMPPKFAPVYDKTKPMRAGWIWRSARVEQEVDEFVIVAECLPSRDNWKAMLIRLAKGESGASVVARFEHHGSHPGLHGHADCLRGGVELGASGLDKLARFPVAGAFHRRTHSWTQDSFWRAAMSFFRVIVQPAQLSMDV